MTKKKNGNKMWIAGAVLGAVAGAAYALWKTPMSGQELRGKLASGPVAQRDDVTTSRTHTPGPADKILSKVEQTLAPLVGVELGKTANGTRPANGAVTEPIAVATPAAEKVPVTSPPKEHATMTKSESEKDPKFDAADPTPDPGRNAADYGNDSIRAKRFAWGSPTPEAGVQPVPTEPMEEDPVTEPALAREPVAPTKVVPPGDGGYGKDSIRSNRFAWGEPAPDATAGHDETTEHQVEENAPLSDQVATAGSTTAGESRPVDAVSDEASTPGSKLRKFPSLGGLE